MASASGARTATLVAHDTALPVASHGFHDENGERSAIPALLEEVSLAGRVITVDAPHTVRYTARSIVESHNVDYRMTAKVLIGIQGSPTFSAHFGPTAGRNGSWGEPPPGQPDLLAANQPCWPFRRCLMKRSCTMKRSFYNK